MERLEYPTVVYTFDRRFKFSPNENMQCIKREEFHYAELVPVQRPTKTKNKLICPNGGNERYDSWYNHYRSILQSRFIKTEVL